MVPGSRRVSTRARSTVSEPVFPTGPVDIPITEFAPIPVPEHMLYSPEATTVRLEIVRPPEIATEHISQKFRELHAERRHIDAKYLRTVRLQRKLKMRLKALRSMQAKLNAKRVSDNALVRRRLLSAIEEVDDDAPGSIVPRSALKDILHRIGWGAGDQVTRTSIRKFVRTHFTEMHFDAEPAIAFAVGLCVGIAGAVSVYFASLNTQV